MINHKDSFTVKRISTVLLITALTGLSTFSSGATTLSEMRALNATQKPGMTIVCQSRTVIPVNDKKEPVTIDERLSGYVVSNTGDMMVLDVTYEQRDDGKDEPFHTEKYLLTTTLENERQKMEVDMRTLKIMVPKARHLESGLREVMEAEPVTYTDYATYRITALPAYELLPDRNNPGAAIMHCAPEHDLTVRK
jgi:hypothetical protein